MTNQYFLLINFYLYKINKIYSKVKITNEYLKNKVMLHEERPEVWLGLDLEVKLRDK